MLVCVVDRDLDRRGAERVAGDLLAFVSRTAVAGGGVIWGDGRGLDAVGVAARIASRLGCGGEGPGCGVAETPIAAYAAALDRSGEDPVVVVEAGRDREFLSDRPLDVLDPGERLRSLLEGVGIETCGELAAVSREAVEVRFGPESVAPWRLARAEDERKLFRPPPTDRPEVSLDFIDYVVTDPEQLVFTTNTLLGGICEALSERGAHARRLELVLPLANGETWRKVLRPARPSASRAVWLRLIRRILERLSVPDAVAGVGLRVLETEAACAVQGDLFDAGFATSAAVESALSRLIETQGPVVVRPEMTAHPLAERRTEFVVLDAESVTEWSGSPKEPERARRRWRAREDGSRLAQGRGVAGSGRTLPDAAGLTLQLLPEPRAITVESKIRRDHRVPVRYRDGEWRSFVTVSGPERISGGHWEDPYAREYYRGITAEGRLVWIYRDAREDRWYLHGWWD